MKIKQGLKSRKPKASTVDSDSKICVVHIVSNTDENVRNLTEVGFNKIQSIASQRQLSDCAHIRLDAVCNSLPKLFVKEMHGAHRKCYSAFTNIKTLKRAVSEESKLDHETQRKKRKVSGPLVLFPSDSCLFCGKKYVYRNRIRENLVKCVTETADSSIKQAAHAKNDNSMIAQIGDIDMRAREVYYHNSCRRMYTRSDVSSRHPSSLETENKRTEELACQEAHENAFSYICNYVEQSIIVGCNVERMTMLREKYLQYMKESYSKFYNSNYKTYKLKDKLIKHFSHRLKFWQPNYKSDLVYSNDIETGSAVEFAFELAASEEKRLEEAATILRRHIKDAFQDAEEMPWPPSAQYLSSESQKLPHSLNHFLSYLISGKAEDHLSDKAELLVNSYSQDMCFAVTNGQWKMQKHMLLGMTIRHITGSAQIITLVNRFGHCQSHTQVLELETAMCNSVVSSDSIIPKSIVPEQNIVTHLCWDNFDLNEETPSGSGTTHSAHGIIIQEKNNTVTDSVKIGSEESSVPKTKQRSINYKPQIIEPCYVKPKIEPALTVSITSADSLENTKAVNDAMIQDFLWVFCRYDKSVVMQIIPSWAGWVSSTSSYPDDCKQSSVDYMQPVMAPITENATVQYLLDISQKATQEVGQTYTIFTGDLAVAKKAYEITWQYPIKYNNTIIRMGIFHDLISYLGCIGKRMNGSGFEEIIIEAGICASGSINQVMSGKHFNRSVRVHTLCVEALERMIFDSFIAQLSSKSNILYFDPNLIKLLYL